MSDEQSTALKASEVKRINSSLSELEKTVSVVCEGVSMVRARLLGSDDQPDCCEEKLASSGWFSETLHLLRLLNERLRGLEGTKIKDLQQATQLEGK